MNLNPYIYLACEQLQNFMMEAAEPFSKVGKHFSQLQHHGWSCRDPLRINGVKLITTCC